MTQTQQSRYENMLAQALINNIAIIGRGTVKATGQAFTIVSSSNGIDCYHVMIDGLRLTCNCLAGQHGQACSHAALARQALLAVRPVPQAQPAAETFRNAPAMGIYRQ